ncbi:MAG: MBL fold metallo-hydrolase, partial [Spirochaetes bacterium]|nr:MBL fold metallo-hydrolase [Spirochaetota bacterium]
MIGGYLVTQFPIYQEDQSIIYLKSFIFVLKHPQFGPILFDTGSPYQSENTIALLKKKFDVSPDEVKWVIYTHIHPDHIGCSHYFKKAKIVLSREELELTCKVAELAITDGDILSFYYDQYPGYRKSFTKVEADNVKYYTKKYWREDLFGQENQRIYLEDSPQLPDFIHPVFTPGHTYQHRTYQLKLPHQE